MTTKRDSMVSMHCFVKTTTVWCFGELIIIVVGVITLLLTILLFHRMIKYQNETYSAVRSFIVYTSIILCLASIGHALFINGSIMSILASYLVSVQCSLFTVFFIKIALRTNADRISISFQTERLFQFIYLFSVNCGQCAFLIYTIIALSDNDEITCHALAFTIFACIDVIQLVITIFAIYFINKKLQKKHEQNNDNNNASLISLTPTPTTTPDNNNRHANNNGNINDIFLYMSPKSIQRNQKMGHSAMLKKSRQLAMLIVFVFINALITAVYETWNHFNHGRCHDYFGVNLNLLNEMLRILARVTWLYVPTLLICYVFWMWPSRTNKYLSDNEMRENEIRKNKQKEFFKNLCFFCNRKYNNNDNGNPENGDYQSYENGNHHRRSVSKSRSKSRSHSTTDPNKYQSYAINNNNNKKLSFSRSMDDNSNNKEESNTCRNEDYLEVPRKISHLSRSRNDSHEIEIPNSNNNNNNNGRYSIDDSNELSICDDEDFSDDSDEDDLLRSSNVWDLDVDDHSISQPSRVVIVSEN